MNKLQRSKNNRVFSGICGGIGEYFNIDPTLVRIAWILLSLSNFGTSLIIYIVCTVIIPEDDGIIYSEEQYERNEKLRQNTPIFIGGGLIIWGAYLLTKIMFPWLNIKIVNVFRLWPALLIILGAYILINQRDH